MEFLSEFQRFVRAELRRFKGREIDTAGDGFFATFDVPARAVRCAMGIAEHVRALGIEIRAGCHTGEVELAKDGVRGVAVVIGARIGALARPGEVVCSSTVKDVTAGSGSGLRRPGPARPQRYPRRMASLRGDAEHTLSGSCVSGVIGLCRASGASLIAGSRPSHRRSALVDLQSPPRVTRFPSAVVANRDEFSNESIKKPFGGRLFGQPVERQQPCALSQDPLPSARRVAATRTRARR